MKLPSFIRINGGDIVEKYLLLTNAHDGSSAVRVKLTPIRVVCENTLTVALTGAEMEVHIRHTANAEAKLKEAHEVLGLSNWLYTELDRIFNGMKDRKMDEREMKGTFGRSFLNLRECSAKAERRRYRKKLWNWPRPERDQMSKGTLWGAYNAVTEYVDHYRLSNAKDNTRLTSMWFGSGERLKKQAFRERKRYSISSIETGGKNSPLY